MQESIWKSRVNTYLGMLLLGSFAFGASLIIWHTATGENPIANEMGAYLASTQL